IAAARLLSLIKPSWVITWSNRPPVSAATRCARSTVRRSIAPLAIRFSPRRRNSSADSSAAEAGKGEAVASIVMLGTLLQTADERAGRVGSRVDAVDRWVGWGDLLHIELGGKRGLDKAGLSEVTRELAIMLAAGQDLDRALRFVKDNTRSARARAILENVHEK